MLEHTEKYSDRVSSNCGIYMIRNTKNGKVYIGQSKNIHWRWMSHKSALNHGRNENPHFQYAWNKYGQDAFEFSIIELCEESLLDSREIYWIEKYNATVDGYNIKDGGNRHSGWKMTDDQRARISEALKGRVRTPEHCKNISLARKEYCKTHVLPNTSPVVCLNTGERFASATAAHKKYPSADISALLACCKGGHLSCGKTPDGVPLVWAYANEYSHMSDDEVAHRLYYNSGVASGHKQRKSIVCLTSGIHFESCADAAEYYNISVSNLNGCLKGRQKTAGKDPDTKEPLYWAYCG